MKKIVSLLILVFALSSCSNSSNNASENLFLNINISGTSYTSEGLFSTGFGGAGNCSNNGDLFLQYVGQIETSALFIDVSFAHFENIVDYSNSEKNNILNTRITDTNSIWTFTTDGINSNFCNLNNDLSIVYEDKGSNLYLDLKPNTQNTHNITNVVFVSEDSQSKFYIIEGNFNCTFLKGSIDVPISGNYRIKVEVLK